MIKAQHKYVHKNLQCQKCKLFFPYVIFSHFKEFFHIMLWGVFALLLKTIRWIQGFSSLYVWGRYSAPFPIQFPTYFPNLCQQISQSQHPKSKIRFSKKPSNGKHVTYFYIIVSFLCVHSKFLNAIPQTKQEINLSIYFCHKTGKSSTHLYIVKKD